MIMLGEELYTFDSDNIQEALKGVCDFIIAHTKKEYVKGSEEIEWRAMKLQREIIANNMLKFNCPYNMIRDLTHTAIETIKNEDDNLRIWEFPESIIEEKKKTASRLMDLKVDDSIILKATGLDTCYLNNIRKEKHQPSGSNGQTSVWDYKKKYSQGYIDKLKENEEENGTNSIKINVGSGLMENASFD